MSSRVIVSLRVSAKPARAFDVFVREIGAWWRPNSLFHFTRESPGQLAFEPGVGGRFTETLPNGRVFEIGRITVWECGARIAFTWRQESFTAGELTQVEVRFEPVGEQTRVTVEHHGWDSVPSRHVARHGFPDDIFLRHHAEWWRIVMSSLALHLA
jgi:uncharacterized protein YndB with AHSA1/START domain